MDSSNALTVKEDTPLGYREQGIADKAVFDRLHKLFANPATIEIIHSHIAHGGTLTTLASTWELTFGQLSGFIHMHPHLDSRYTKALAARTEWTVETLLKELRAIALCDIREAFDDKGQMLPPNKWPEHLARAVQSVETVEMFEKMDREMVHVGDTKKIKFIDKLKAIELLGKNLSLFIDRVDVQTTISLEQLINQIHVVNPEEKK